MKRHAPSTLRNRDAIAGVLAKELPENGTVLEIASGSGEHAVYFAERFPSLTWQPTDHDQQALSSIDAYRAEYDGNNVLSAKPLNASSDRRPVDHAAALLCINMVHISPWAATIGLFSGAQRILPKDAPVILYGPFFESDVVPAQSNVEFDLSLRSRDEQWGIRQLGELDEAAIEAGFTRSKRYEMPANNLMLVYRKQASG